MLYYIARFSFLVFFKVYLGFKVVGGENVPKKGAFILASNHSSYLDPILLASSLKRGLYYLARDTLFKKRCFGWLMRQVHSFPVKRNKGDLRAIRDSLRILGEGRPLVIFPEGTRTKDEQLDRGKPGIGFIAAKAGVPVLPAYVAGSFKALPRGFKTLKRHPVAVYIGEPVTFDRKYFEANGRDLYQRISDEIMKRIAELSRLSQT